MPKLLPYTISGPVGNEILRLPEGSYVSTFLAQGSLARYLMGIGLVESGGGTSTLAYMGCLDGVSYGSWPGQIACAANAMNAAISACGSLYSALGRYNTGSCDGNPTYSDDVLNYAAGIQVVRR